jgi:glutathione S-transferase
MKAYALQSGLSRLTYLENHLTGRGFLLDRFSVADAYLVTVLNWTMVLPEIDLNNWPAIKAYHKRLRERPSIVRAVTEEFELFKAEQERHKAAA